MEKEEEKTLYRAVIVFIMFGDLVLLAKKTKKIGKGLWNGYGGGIEDGESPEDAAVRETSEESVGITIEKKDLLKVADTYFHNTKEDGSNFTLNAVVYIVKKYKGTPSDTEEMIDPTWFNKNNLPLDQMMPADKIWVPIVLSGKKIKFYVSFSPHQAYMTSEPRIEYVDSF